MQRTDDSFFHVYHQVRSSCDRPAVRSVGSHYLVELALKSRSDYRRVHQTQPLLDDLRDRIGETVSLCALSRSQGVVIAAAEALTPLKISLLLGTLVPPTAGALGKAFLARFDREKALRLIREHGLPGYTPKTITDEQAYLRELNRVRKAGYALDEEEYLPGVRAVAVNLDSHHGFPLALWVVVLAGSTAQGRLAFIIQEILDSARKMRALLQGAN